MLRAFHCHAFVGVPTLNRVYLQTWSVEIAGTWGYSMAPSVTVFIYGIIILGPALRGTATRASGDLTAGLRFLF